MAVLQEEASGWIWHNGLYSWICLGWWVPREYYCFRQATTTLLLSTRTLESQSSYLWFSECSQAMSLFPTVFFIPALPYFTRKRAKSCVLVSAKAQCLLKAERKEAYLEGTLMPKRLSKVPQFWWNRFLSHLGNLLGAKLKQEKSNFCPLPGYQSWRNVAANMIDCGPPW